MRWCPHHAARHIVPCSVAGTTCYFKAEGRASCDVERGESLTHAYRGAKFWQKACDAADADTIMEKHEAAGAAVLRCGCSSCKSAPAGCWLMHTPARELG